MANKAPAKSKKGMSAVGRDILAGLKEYASHKHGEKTGIKIYTFPKVPEDGHDRSTHLSAVNSARA